MSLHAGRVHRSERSTKPRGQIPKGVIGLRSRDAHDHLVAHPELGKLGDQRLTVVVLAADLSSCLAVRSRLSATRRKGPPNPPVLFSSRHLTENARSSLVSTPGTADSGQSTERRLYVQVTSFRVGDNPLGAGRTLPPTPFRANLTTADKSTLKALTRAELETIGYYGFNPSFSSFQRKSRAYSITTLRNRRAYWRSAISGWTASSLIAAYRLMTNCCSFVESTPLSRR